MRFWSNCRCFGPPTLDRRRRMAVLAAARRHTVACQSDGRVLAVGNGQAGECDVLAWSDIIAVAARNVHTASNTGKSHTVGLRADGTVVATGWNGDGQCAVSQWSGISSIAAGWRFTLGVTATGSVVATGRNREGQCDVAEWTDIAAVAWRLAFGGSSCRRNSGSGRQQPSWAMRGPLVGWPRCSFRGLHAHGRPQM